MFDTMITSPARFPSREEGLRVHQRLLAGDPTAPSDLAGMYLDALIGWLLTHNRSIDPDFCFQAAADSILSLISDPGSYDPGRQTLEVYLRMAAKRDLLNILERENRHRHQRRTLASVELSPEAGKYLGRENDPFGPLQSEEAVREAWNGVPASVREGLAPRELAVLELMLGQERKTEVYARAFGIEDLPAEEQREQIKRVKDRLKKRLDRARTTDE
jgi:RNA polymerase sigma-70 factor (ECF subfamily)